jgi:hypothetical protein
VSNDSIDTREHMLRHFKLILVVTNTNLVQKHSTQIVSGKKSTSISVQAQNSSINSSFAEPQPSYEQLHKHLVDLSSSKRAAITARYFRVNEYGSNDVLMGISVPDVRSVSKAMGFFGYPLLRQLNSSKYHEERLLALVDIVNRYKLVQKAENDKDKEEIFNFYVNDMRNGIDNWDLVGKDDELLAIKWRFSTNLYARCVR